MKIIGIILLISVSLVLPAVAACPLTASIFPEFSAMPPAIPSFDGKSCSLDAWQSYNRSLAPLGGRINEYDDARLEHDRRVRAFDRQLQLALARDECSVSDYEELSGLVSEANIANAGIRKENWWTLQTKLAGAQRDAQRSIERLNIDLAARCEQ